MVSGFSDTKKYNLKATIFINPEFIDESTKNIRKINFENYSEKDNSLGFLNWSEVIHMQNSGIIDFQSHSLTHNYYFKIIKYY